MTSQDVAHDPYWHEDVTLFEGSFRAVGNAPTLVRSRVHISEEAYDLDPDDQEAPLVSARRGTRTYLDLQPYLLEPKIVLTVGLSPADADRQAKDGVVGTVLDSTWEGMRHRVIGRAWAYHYPLDGVTLLWECFVHRPFLDRHHPLPNDPTMHALWHAVEAYLLERFPATRQLVTWDRDTLFDDRDYQQFLASLGFAPVAHELYGKEINKNHAEHERRNRDHNAGGEDDAAHAG